MTDTDRRTEPALTDKQWREALSAPPGVIWGFGPETEGAADRHVIAAMCLYGQPEGFTWEDVDAIRAVANGWTMDAENHDVLPGLTAHERAIRDRALSAADRLAALLPPR